MTEEQRQALRDFVTARFRDGLPTGARAVTRALREAGLEIDHTEIHRACSRLPFIAEPRRPR